MWFKTLAERMAVIIFGIAFGCMSLTVVLVVFIVYVLGNSFGLQASPRGGAPYRGAAGGGGTTAPPTTPPPDPPPDPSAGDLIVWAVGDNCDDDFTSQQNTNVEGCKHVGDMIKADSSFDRLLLLGDTQYQEGELVNFNTYYDKGMGKQQIIASSTDSLWTRSIASVGNHEYLTTDATGYFAYFGTTRSGDPDKGYYMVDLGAWRIIVLNSNCSHAGPSPAGCGPTSSQGMWAIDALDAATAAGDSTIAIFHHPPYSDGAGYAPTTTSGLQMWNTIYSHGVDIVLTGHDHQYQRFGPLSQSGTPDSSGPYFWVSGAGGRGNNGFSTLSGTDRTLYEWGKQADGTQKEPGALRLVLSTDGNFTFAFKTSQSGVGTTRDSGSGDSR